MTREQINGSRHYVTPDGNKVASVTTILSATASKEKLQSLENWRKKVGHQNAANITAESSGRGTRMHSYLEKYIETGILPSAGTNPHAMTSHNMAARVIEKGLSQVTASHGIECQLFYPELYAGTTDLVGDWQGDLAIIDYKQSNKPKKREWIDDYFIQLASYATAHNVMYGTNINTGVILMCTPDLEYQEFVITGSEFDMWANKWWDKVHQYYSK